MAKKKNTEKEVLIIKSAMIVFSEKGFSKSSMQDIANEAEIGKGTIYEYFKSKDELFIEGYRSLMGKFIAMTREVVMDEIPFEKKIDDFIKLIQDAFEEKGKKIKLLLHDSLSDLKPDSRRLLEMLHLDMREQVFELFSRVLKQGIEEKRIRELDLSFISRALVSFTFVVTMMNMSFRNEDKPLTTDQKKIERELVLDLILNGVARI